MKQVLGALLALVGIAAAANATTTATATTTSAPANATFKPDVYVPEVDSAFTKPSTLQQLLLDPTWVDWPTEAVFTAQIADLSEDMEVWDQWDSWEAYIEYAWDLNKNCYSEVWYVEDAIVMGTVTCRNKTTTVGMNGKCTTVADNTNISSKILNYYATFNMTEGLVFDDFGQFDWGMNSSEPATLYQYENEEDYLID